MAIAGDMTVTVDSELRTIPNTGRFVLEVDDALSIAQHELIARDWERFWGDDAPKLLILDRGRKLRAIEEV